MIDAILHGIAWTVHAASHLELEVLLIVNSPTHGRVTRLNPFAFPSDTDIRFVILIVAVIGASLFIYDALYYAISANTDYIRMIDPQCRAAAHASYPGNSTAQQIAQATAYFQCEKPLDQSEAEWVSLGIALLLSVAGAIYWAFPSWKIWRGGLKLLGTENAPPDLVAYLRDLCREAGLSRSPVFLLNPYRSAQSGVTFGRLGRYYVVLTSGLVMQFRTAQPAFRAVVLHELGHVRNADVDKTYFTIAIGWAFGVAALFPWVAVQFLPPWRFDQTFFLGFFNVGWRILVLAVLIYLIRNAILRAREVYADVRASVWDGQAGALDRVLQALPRLKGGHWQYLLHKHPDPQERCQALDDTSRLFRLSFWDAFVTGVAAASVLSGVLWFLGLLQIGVEVERIVSGTIFAPLLVGVVGLGAWRATFANQVRGAVPPDTTRVSLGLALGLLLGQTLSLFSSQGVAGYFTDVGLPSLAQFTLSSFLDQGGFPLFWGMLFLAILFFFFRWIVAGAVTWMEVALSGSSPRLTYWITLALGSGVLGIWFGQFSGQHTVAQRLPGSSNFGALGSNLLFVVENVAVNPLTCLTFVCLWAYLLSAFFWQKRTTPITRSNWVFLDSSSSSHPLSLPSQPPFRLVLALVMGLAGGLAFCGMLPLFITGFHLELHISDEIELADLLQAGMAAIVASSVRRLGGLHGLFAAFVAGCVMTVGILGFFLLHTKEGIDRDFVWTVFSLVVNGGAFVALPVVFVVSALAKWARHLGCRDVSMT
jgi:Zn-dependent protease with chaperone function